jgi:hypothetical protein
VRGHAQLAGDDRDHPVAREDGTVPLREAREVAGRRAERFRDRAAAASVDAVARGARGAIERRAVLVAEERWRELLDGVGTAPTGREHGGQREHETPHRRSR